MQLGLFLTARCNAQCTHCTTDSGPRKTRALDTATLFRLMNEAAALRLPEHTLEFALTGGEAFLDFPRLLEVVAHGARLGGRVSCTTNGSWASEDGKAHGMLEALRAAGLTALAASTSRFHQQYIKPDRVRRALRLARELGIHTTLKCAITASDRESGWAERFADTVHPDELQIFPVAPYVRNGAELPVEEYIREPGLPAGTCPGPVLTVREDGNAYTCCNPGGFAELLRLGDVNDTGLDELRELYLVGGVQQVLREQGPIRFAREAIAQGQGHRLRAAYGGVCDLCGHIASDPVLSRIAAGCAEAGEQAQLKAAFQQLLEEAPAREGGRSIIDRRRRP